MLELLANKKRIIAPAEASGRDDTHPNIVNVFVADKFRLILIFVALSSFRACPIRSAISKPPPAATIIHPATSRQHLKENS